MAIGTSMKKHGLGTLSLTRSQVPWPLFTIAISLLWSEGLAQDSNPFAFRKITLNPQFYSEGIQFGDVNRDQVNDIIAGPYWYPGPDFSEKRAFRQPRTTPFPISGDSDCYSIFLFDFNQDGWLDILSFRRDGGAEAVWYENPKGGSGYWPEHSAFSSVENESAALIDIDKDGKPEIITNSKGYGGFVQPNESNPASPWTFKAVTPKHNWTTFTHGIGAGDLNGDGRLDLIFADSWWEQPPAGSNSLWVQHEASFGGQANPSEGFGGAQIVAYDVDGDGDQDVVTSLQAHGWGLAWYENLGKGQSFQVHTLMNTPAEIGEYGIAFSQLHALALADLDGDGLQDIVTGKRKGAHGVGLGSDIDSPAVLYAFRLTREEGKPPHYAPYLIDNIAGVGTQVTVGDVNGDGSPDILTARRDGAFVFLNQKIFPSALSTLGETSLTRRIGPSDTELASQQQSLRAPVWRFFWHNGDAGHGVQRNALGSAQ